MRASILALRGPAIACDPLPMGEVAERFLERISEVESVSDATQKAAAATAGITSAAVGHWKRRVHSPTLDNLEDYAKALGGQLVIDIFHPAEGKSVLLASAVGAEVARLIDSMDEEDQGLLLQVIRAVPEYHAHREMLRGALRDIVRALGAIRHGD